MLERGRGHIVNMGSVAAVVTPPGLVHYGASKAGLAHYTAGLRLELKGLPIGLTLVQIGSTDTEMDDATQAYPPYETLRRGRPVEKVRFPIEQVVDGVIEAVREDKPHVVLPRSLRALTSLVEIPRGVMRLAFRKASPRP
jgi:short-subunit dehydrogenase